MPQQGKKMNKYNSNIHHRRSIRLKGYDYAQAGLYFITICCQDRAHLFGEIINEVMVLNEYGKIAFTEWENSMNIRDNIHLHDFVIMPNHIHGIIEIVFKKANQDAEELEIAPITKFQSPSQTIGSIVRGYKIATIKKIKNKVLEESSMQCKGECGGELQFALTHTFALTEKIIQLDFKIWQRNYYEHIIRDEASHKRISDYILNNPAQWTDDKFYQT